MQLAIPDDLGAELHAVANRNGESPEEYARQAIANFLEDLEDLAIATERLESPGETISLEDLKSNLAAVCSGRKVEAAPRLPLFYRTATTGVAIRKQ